MPVLQLGRCGAAERRSAPPQTPTEKRKVRKKLVLPKKRYLIYPRQEATMSELIGRKLGKYILEAQLGEGGMAAVYRSQHPQFHRPVAIKILPPTIGQDPSFRARFEREGRTIASLNHPSIIRVYDIDEADGLFY